MKILYLCRKLNVGGVEKNITLLSNELKKNNHEVLVGASDGIIRGDLEKNGIKCVLFKHNFRNPIDCLSDLCALHKVITIEKPDILHIFSINPAINLFVYKLFIKIMTLGIKKLPPVVCSIMGLVNSSDESPYISYIRTLGVTLGSKRIFVISPKIHEVVSRLPINRKRIKLQHVVGIEVPERSIVTVQRDSIKKELNLKDDDRAIMTIGRLDDSKNHELFINAAELLRSKKIKWFIIGEGPSREILEKLIKDNSLDDNVYLLGQRSDIYELLSVCDIYIRPGIIEGFVGITVFEAQILGIPVLAFDTKDVRIAIKDGETGFLVKNNDVKDLADKIDYCLHNNEICRVVGENGCGFVKKNFEISNIVKKLVNAYEEEIK